MAGRIREADIALVRERARIEDVIGEYVALKRAGAGALKGLCPFHDEKSPSFNVRPAHGAYHCFGCGVSGDVIAFVMAVEHIPFVEAVEQLAGRVGVSITYSGGGASVQRDRGTRTRLAEINKLAAEFYAGQLRSPEAEKARAYLTERGFDASVAADFGCGYAPAGWEALTRHLLGKGFGIDELIKAGVSREGRQGPIDRFRRRLLWPIRELSGDVAGFGARRLFDDDPIEAKYVNTADTPLYRKSQLLFGLDKAKREIARRRQAVVVEGYTDVMAMHLAGVPTAVASCGTAFGTEHISVLRRLLMDDDAFRGEVVFVFDGDEAGQKAALRAFEDDQSFAAQTFIAVAPAGMDPCELRQAHGDTELRDLVARRRPLFEFAITTMLRGHDLDTVEGQVAALREAAPLVARIKDQAIRDRYAVRLAYLTGYGDEASVVRRVRELAGSPPPAKPSRRARPARAAASDAGAAGEAGDAGPPLPDAGDRALRAERDVLKVALQVPALAGPVFDALTEEAFDTPAYRAVYRAVQAAGGTGAGLAGPEWADAVREHCNGTALRRLVGELSVEVLPTRDEQDTRYVAGIMAGLQMQLIGRQVAEVKARLRRLSPVDAAEEYHQLFGDLIALEQYHKALREQTSGALLP